MYTYATKQGVQSLFSFYLFYLSILILLSVVFCKSPNIHMYKLWLTERGMSTGGVQHPPDIGLMAETKLIAWKLPSFVTNMLLTDSVCSMKCWPTPLSLVVNSGITDLSHGLGSLENYNIDGLVWDCNISNALAMEMLQSCTRPSTCLARGMGWWFRTSPHGGSMLLSGDYWIRFAAFREW